MAVDHVGNADELDATLFELLVALPDIGLISRAASIS